MIYLAVSNSSDPTAGFNAFQIPVNGPAGQFNDFETLGLDADGVYLTTQNFAGGGGFNGTSLYSIPKADLVAAVPSIANLTRIENQPTGTLPFRTQPAVDFGPSDGRGAMLAANFAGGTTLQRLDVLGGGTANCNADRSNGDCRSSVLVPCQRRSAGTEAESRHRQRRILIKRC